VNSDLSKVPQDWALYKEVQEYYEKGMRVPDDVTLLWCDRQLGAYPQVADRGGTKAQRRRRNLLSISITSAILALTSG